jgi:hypothetical protein
MRREENEALARKREVWRVYERGMGVRRSLSQPPTQSSIAVKFLSIMLLRISLAPEPETPSARHWRA